jgi:hypothetical protein
MLYGLCNYDPLVLGVLAAAVLAGVVLAGGTTSRRDVHPTSRADGEALQVRMTRRSHLQRHVRKKTWRRPDILAKPLRTLFRVAGLTR